MLDLVYLFKNPAYLVQPTGVVGWLGWLFLLGATIALNFRLRAYNRPWAKRRWLILTMLSALVPVTSLALPGLRLSESGILFDEPVSPVVMILAALPWFLGASLIGPVSGGALAAFSGLFLAIWGTHNPYLPLELAFLGSLTSVLTRQGYRSAFFTIIRHPIVASILIGLVYPGIYIIDAILVSDGGIADRLNYALSFVIGTLITVLPGLFIAGLTTEVLYLTMPGIWDIRFTERTSPAERSLAARFLYGIAPLAVCLVVFVILGDWIVAGNIARQMLKGRMENSAKMTAQSVPFVLETGQKLILDLATDRKFYTLPADQLRESLSQDLITVPYFSQLIFLDADGNPVTGYPEPDIGLLALTSEERKGIQYALKSVSVQFVPVQPDQGATAAILSFLAQVKDQNGSLHGVLLGRSDLSANPFAQPLLASLESVTPLQGEGMLVDDKGRILYHPIPGHVMTLYTGQINPAEQFYTEIGENGTRKLVFYKPVVGPSWAVILTVPTRYVQQQALYLAGPLLIVIVVFSLIAFMLFSLRLRTITASLRRLAVEADRIASGQLDQPLLGEGVDEVGQLGRAFEQMRASLKARIDELNRLLLVSQGVASTLEIGRALKPVLDSALVPGASSARAILVPAMVPDLDSNKATSLAYGSGVANERYGHLDEQVQSLTRGQDLVVLTNLTRTRLFVFPEGRQRPQAILALALRHESLYYGAFWVAYDEPHQFSDEEIRYLVTLAGQAALAAANTRLFLTAEIGRQRLEAILASTPDPVLVTDHRNHILLANLAACNLLSLQMPKDQGQPIENAVQQEALIKFLRSSAIEKESIEIAFQNGLIYLATASSVMADGHPVGRVCIMRDVTRFKELDTLRSDFVFTVSHDLRHPLTLIRGYANMLQMVGELNEQQDDYASKIIAGVEEMSRLVNNLLDLGRIEKGVGLQLEKQPVSDVVERVVNALQPQAIQKHILLRADLPQQTFPLIEADQALLQQAIQNLVDNAINFTKSGGEVTIGLKIFPQEVIFEVRDTGIGIAPADQHRLFERFYRGNQQGTKNERGSGLGLAIVKSIADRHGGQIWVESQLGKGSIFSLVVPLYQTQAQKK